jgi:glutamine amidotransferase-like uncharacterized protein
MCAMGCSTQKPNGRTEVAVATPECLDVSGKYMYQGSDGQVHISIAQERCDRVTIRRDTGYLGKITSEEHVLKLDGKVHEDSPWLGSTDQYKTSAKFNRSALQIETTSSKGSTLTMIYSLTSEGDLREEALINGKSGGSIVAKREKISILLFSGTGTSPDDVKAIEAVLISNQLDYSTVSSFELNRMKEDDLRRYRLLVFPGGNFVDMGNGLASTTIANIRDAVHNGLNYLGVCAGAFLAGNFPAPYKSLNLTSGVKFGFYSAENRGLRKAAVAITVAGGPALDQYWEDGPQLSGWGEVVGKYPDGTPAIVEGTSGAGWMILTGIHAEAPESWRHGMTFKTPATEDNTYAGTLIQAALNRTPLSHF